MNQVFSNEWDSRREQGKACQVEGPSLWEVAVHSAYVGDIG